ncbi:MAG: indole-3-glycerol phosphate synthase TrpC [Treponema sp.]|nr:indole-3-glycerol phosphate synthase TrpC [Treponema sp.]
MKTPPAILGKIAESTLVRVAEAKKMMSPEQIKNILPRTTRTGTCSTFHEKNGGVFYKALSATGLSFICEVKKASPSKGIISRDFPYLEIAKDYEDGEAAAISVLTEPQFFLGSEQYLREISAAVKIPTLRKDFIIDPYQIYEAKLWGAKAVLLICALLEKETLSEYMKIAKGLELDCLVEIHSEQEAQEAIEAGSSIIGINNRDLTTFKVDTGLTARLKKLIPAGILTVAESGINTTDDIKELKEIGVDAVLIGESLMRATDRKSFLKELKSV